MQTQFEIYSLGQLEEAGKEFRSSDDPSQVSIIPPAVWELAITNPDHPRDMPVAATVRMDGKRVARINLVHLGIETGTGTFPCLTGHSLYSHPEVRAPGVGGLLMRQMFDAVKARRIAFAAYGATPYANRLMAALRAVVVGVSPRWILPLRSGPIVRKRLGEGVASKAVSFVGDLALKGFALAQRARLRPSAKGYAIEERPSITSVPEIEPPGSPPRFRFRRTPAILNWKRDFARLDPSARLRAFHVVDESGKDVACFLVRVATHAQAGSQQFKNVRICRVLDLLYPPSDELARIALLGLLRVAASERADVLEILTTDARVGALCRSTGFRQSNGYDFVVTRTEGLPDDAYDLKRWFLMMMEGEPAYS